LKGRWHFPPIRRRQRLTRGRSLWRRLVFRRLFWLQLFRIIPRRLLAGDKHRRIFVSMMGGVGDLVMLGGVLEELSQSYTIDFGAAGEPYLSLVRSHPSVARIYTPFIYHPKRVSQRRLIERVLTPFYARVLLLEFADANYWKAGIHVSRLFAERCGGSPPDRGRVYLSARHRMDADAYLNSLGIENFIFIAQVIRDRQPFRSWPLAAYHGLYRLLLTHLGTTLVVCTAGSDCIDLPADVVRLPSMELHAVAAVIERACLFIGTDGGLTHIAAAVGVPTLSIHLGYPPEICGALGKNVTLVRQSQPFDDPALTTPEQVFRVVATHLGR
jgi:ADP-heptose:LPS heptosyltransferase